MYRSIFIVLTVLSLGCSKADNNPVALAAPGGNAPVANTAADADNWAQFRGPGGMGISKTTTLPTSWSDSENVVWKTELPGLGASSPIIHGKHLFLSCFTGYGEDRRNPGDLDDLERHVLCMDASSGDILWKEKVKTVLPEMASRRFLGFTSSTPAADAERVYFFFGKSGVVAFDHAGKQLWQTGVGERTHGWGSASSPLLYRNLVIVNAFVECGQLVALDRKTGKEVWRAGDLKESWNTPLLVTLPNGKTELVVAIARRILGFDPDTGQSLWSCEGHKWYIVPSLIAHDGVVYCLSGKGVEAIKAVKAGGRGDVTDSHVLWTTEKGSNVPSPIVHQGHIYFPHERTGVAYCLNAKTGKVVYEESLPRMGGVYASPVLGAGKLYYVSRGGGTAVIAATPEYKLLAHNRLEGDRDANASPAISGERLYLRLGKFMYCLGEK